MAQTPVWFGWVLVADAQDCARIAVKNLTKCRKILQSNSAGCAQTVACLSPTRVRGRQEAHRAGRREVTAQAFSQARYKISALVFGEVNQELIRLAETHLPIPRWEGLRLVAADGSGVRLTVMKEGIRSIVNGMAFGLYLPGIERFLDFRLHQPLCDERQMFFEAIDRLRPDDLLLMDRGFPCRWLVSVLTARQLHFCIRLEDSKWYASS